MKKILACVLLAMTAVMLLSGCSGGSTVESIQKSGKLVVATSADFPPFEYIENNEYAGIDMELAQLLADKLGVELQIDNLTFEGVLASISAGKCDLGMSAISLNPERQKTMDFSNPYFVTTVRIVTLASNSDITDLASLSGKKVGVQLGTISDEVATAAGNIEVTRMNKDLESIMELLAGRLDAAILDESPGKVYVAKNEGKLKMLDATLSDEDSYVIATKKGNQELVDFVNEAVAEIQSSGQLDVIMEKYLG